jgi:hypothetical protein
MANTPAINDYTNRDYESLLQSLLDQAALKLPEWTDRSENDLGRLLLESFAYVGDVLLYYQDRIANEAFLSTAVERRSVIDLLSLIGYTLATPAPATAELRLDIPNNSPDPIRIEAGARFATQASLNNPAVEFLYLPVDGQPLEILRDGSGRPEKIQYPNLEKEPPDPKLVVTQATRIENEPLGQSSGEPNQSFRPRQSPVLLSRNPDRETYLTVEVDAGSGYEQWQRRGTLLHSLDDSQHYRVQVDGSDHGEIIFGDGKYGQIPPLGSTIRATYLIGGGATGNVGKGTITKVTSGVNPLPEVVTNPKAASGGADRETIAHARQQAPAVYRSLQRAVTPADYVALAENFPGILKAAVEAPGWNFVDIYVVAQGNQPPTDDLRAKLLQYFDDKRMVTTLVNIRQPQFVTINITVNKLGIEPTHYVQDVKGQVQQAINGLFAMERLEFRQSFYISKVYEAIENLPGVAFVQVSFERTPADETQAQEARNGIISLQTKEFPQKGRLELPDNSDTQRLIGGLR